MKEAVLLLVTGALIGTGGTHLWHARKAAEAEAEAEAALAAERSAAEKRNATAAETILVAQAEYRSVADERDALLARLREQSDRRPSADDSAESLRKRVAHLEGVVKRLSESAARCDRGWAECAQKHDALVDAVRR